MGCCCSSSDLSEEEKRRQQKLEEKEKRRKLKKLMKEMDNKPRKDDDDSDFDFEDDDDEFSVNDPRRKMKRKRNATKDGDEGGATSINPLSGDSEANNNNENGDDANQQRQENDGTPLESEDSNNIEDPPYQEEPQQALQVKFDDQQEDDVHREDHQQQQLEQEEKTPERNTEPSHVVRGDENSLHLRTSTFDNKYEAVSIGNKIFISELHHHENNDSGNNATTIENRAVIRPIGFLGGEEEERMKSRSCSALAFSHDSSLIVTATREGRISIWSTETGQQHQAFGWSASIRNFNAVAANNSKGSRSGSVVTFGVQQQQQRSSSVTSTQSSVNGFGFLSGGNNSAGGFLGGSNNPNDVACSDVFKGIELSGDLTKRRSSTSFGDFGTMGGGGEASSSGEGANSNLMMMEQSLSSSKGATTSATAAIHCITWSRNDQNIFCGLADGTIQIWDVASCSLREDVPVIYGAHSSWVVSLDVSENGKYLASASIDETVCIFDVSVLMPRTSSNGTAVFTPSSSSQQEDGNNNNKHEIKLLHRIEGGHSACVNCVRFAKDIKIESSSSFSDSSSVSSSSSKKKFKNYSHIITASSDKTIKCWDVRTGKQRGETISQENFGSHSDSVTSISISKPDGKFVVSVSQDRTLCRFDVDQYFFNELYHPTNNNNSTKEDGDENNNQNQQHTSPVANDETFGIQFDVTKSTTNAIVNESSGVYANLTSASGMISTRNNNPHNHQQQNRVDRLRSGHKDNITDVCFIPKSLVAVTSSLDELLKVWNMDPETNHSSNFHLGTGSSASQASGASSPFTTAHRHSTQSNINNNSNYQLSAASNLSRNPSNASTTHSPLQIDNTGASFDRKQNDNTLLVSGTTPEKTQQQQNGSQHALLSPDNNNNGSNRRIRSGGFASAASAQSLLSSVTSQKNLKTLLADVQVNSRVYAVSATTDGYVLACGRMDGRTPLFAVCRGTPLSKRPLELEEKVMVMGFTDDGKELVATDSQGDTTRFLLSTVK